MRHHSYQSWKLEMIKGIFCTSSCCWKAFPGLFRGLYGMNISSFEAAFQSAILCSLTIFFQPIFPIYLLLCFAVLFPPLSKCPSGCCRLLCYPLRLLLSKDGLSELVQSVSLLRYSSLQRYLLVLVMIALKRGMLESLQSSV